MPKEKNYNPVQAQRKADKAKALKKGKADIQERRNERFARKNPDRIQKQIDDLKAASQNGGKLTKHEEQVLQGLEKELKAVKRARETLGDKAPSVGRSWHRDDGGRLGKRRRGSQDGSSDEEDVPEDVRRIPMPGDTPPPIPKEILDEWYSKRRARREAEMAARRARDGETDERRDDGGSAAGKKQKEEAAAAPVVESKTVYEAKPVVRDLRKEAVSAFMPSSVQMKVSKGTGQGGLMEPEEADKLEREGYLKVKREEQEDGQGEGHHAEEGRGSLRTVTVEDVEDDEEEG